MVFILQLQKQREITIKCSIFVTEVCVTTKLIKGGDDPDASIVMDMSWILQQSPIWSYGTPDARLLCEMRQLSGSDKINGILAQNLSLEI